MNSALSADAGDGLELAVHELGGRGPTLLLCHATGYCGGVWQPVADELHDVFRCLGPDARAHGASGIPDSSGFGWGALGADVLAVIDRLGLQSPVYGSGHSAGATGLLLAEVLRPGTFEGLWCFESVVFPPRSHDEDEPEGVVNPMSVAARGRRWQFADRDEAYLHYETRPPFRAFHPAALKAFVDCGLTDDKPGEGLRLSCRPENEALFYELGGLDEVWFAVEQIGCPVTFATGDGPGAFGEAHAELLAGRIAFGQAEVLPGLSHFGPLESPARIAASIRDSLGPVNG